MLKKLLASCVAAAILPAAVHASQPESGSPLRTVVDSGRELRWELQWNGVMLYDASTSVLLRRFALEGAAQSSSRESCLPDLAIGRDGVAHVTSNVQPVLWRIDPASLRVERVELDVDADRAKDFGFTSLGWSADGVTLYAAGANDGATWRLDAAAAKAYKLDAATDRDCDGMR